MIMHLRGNAGLTSTRLSRGDRVRADSGVVGNPGRIRSIPYSFTTITAVARSSTRSPPRLGHRSQRLT